MRNFLTIIVFFALLLAVECSLAANWMRLEDIKAKSVRGFELYESCTDGKHRCIRVDQFMIFPNFVELLDVVEDGDSFSVKLNKQRLSESLAD